MEFAQVVRRRRMVRNYADSPIPEDKLDRILRIARRAPSAGFSQGQSFVVVTDRKLRRQIGMAAGEADYVSKGFDPWISKAPLLVVLCASESVYRARYREWDKLGPQGELDWPIPYWYVDAGASLMLLLLAAVDEGLGAGFLGLKSVWIEELKKLLEIPVDVQPIGIVTVGPPAPDRPSGSLARGWRPEVEVIHHEHWADRASPREAP
ncbi:MAG: nitroreductase family protein [Actinomycetota bacterium]